MSASARLPSLSIQPEFGELIARSGEEDSSFWLNVELGKTGGVGSDSELIRMPGHETRYLDVRVGPSGSKVACGDDLLEDATVWVSKVRKSSLYRPDWADLRTGQQVVLHLGQAGQSGLHCAFCTGHPDGNGAQGDADMRSGSGSTHCGRHDVRQGARCGRGFAGCSA